MWLYVYNGIANIKNYVTQLEDEDKFQYNTLLSNLLISFHLFYSCHMKKDRQAVGAFQSMSGFNGQAICLNQLQSLLHLLV
jgi:hypothetical protein